MERRGVVMEVRGQTVIVMTNQGEFCSLPIQSGMEVGVEVFWAGSTLMSSNSGRKSRSFLRGSKVRRFGVAGLAACVALAVGVWQGIDGMRSTQAYAYVSLDINPSVKFTVNRHLQVVSAVPGDQDGKALLTNVGVHSGESLRQAIRQIVNAAVDAKLVPKEGTILIAAAPGTNIKSSEVERVQTEVQTDVKSALQTNQNGKDLKPVVFSFGLSHNVWNAVDKAGISPGKFAAVLAAQQSGVHVNINQLSRKQTEKVLREALQGSNNDSATVTVSDDTDGKKVNDLIAEVKSGKQGGSVAHADAIQTVGGSASGNVSGDGGQYIVTPNPKKAGKGDVASSPDQQSGDTGSSPGTGKPKGLVDKQKGNSHGNGNSNDKGKGNEQSNGNEQNNGGDQGNVNNKEKGNGHNKDHGSNGSGGQRKGKSNHQNGVGIPAEVGNLVENSDGNTADKTSSGNRSAIDVGGSVSIDNHGSKAKNQRDHAKNQGKKPKKSQDSTSASNPGDAQSGTLNHILGGLPNAPTSFGSGNITVGNSTNSDDNGLQWPDGNSFASNYTNDTNQGPATGDGKTQGKGHGKDHGTGKGHQTNAENQANNGTSSNAIVGNATSGSGGNLLGNLPSGASTGVTGAGSSHGPSGNGLNKQNPDQQHNRQGKSGQHGSSDDRSQSHGQSSKKHDSGLQHSRQSNEHPSLMQFGSDLLRTGQLG